jgi:hypothetical protein
VVGVTVVVDLDEVEVEVDGDVDVVGGLVPPEPWLGGAPVVLDVVGELRGTEAPGSEPKVS